VIQIYIYRWDRQGRKGQQCECLIRTKVMNSCLVRFADGYTMVTSRNALRKAPSDASDFLLSERSDEMSDGKSEILKTPAGKEVFGG